MQQCSEQGRENSRMRGEKKEQNSPKTLHGHGASSSAETAPFYSRCFKLTVEMNLSAFLRGQTEEFGFGGSVKENKSSTVWTVGPGLAGAGQIRLHARVQVD